MSASVSPCGPALDRCRCRDTGPVARTPEEMAARHEAAVARARRTDERVARAVEDARIRRAVQATVGLPVLPVLSPAARRAAFAAVVDVICTVEADNHRGAA